MKSSMEKKLVKTKLTATKSKPEIQIVKVELILLKGNTQHVKGINIFSEGTTSYSLRNGDRTKLKVEFKVRHSPVRGLKMLCMTSPLIKEPGKVHSNIALDTYNLKLNRLLNQHLGSTPNPVKYNIINMGDYAINPENTKYVYETNVRKIECDESDYISLDKLIDEDGNEYHAYRYILRVR